MIGDYPTQLDKIDQWLNDNFGILPGACSSTESLRYSVARRVAEALWPKTQSLPSDVEEAANEIAYNMMPVAMITNCEDGHPDYDAWGALREKFIEGFKAGAEWQKSQMIRDCSVQASYEAEIEKAEERGYNLCKEQMLKAAVEGYVNYYEDGGGKLMAEAQVGCPYHIGDKVKIVIVKED